eukprot:PITA_34998
MFLLHKRLKHIKLRLKDWNKNEFGNIFEVKKVVEDKKKELNQALIKDGFDKFRNDQVTKHNQDWDNLCKQEEIYWRQKSRVQWLKEGERNTRFFHGSTMVNRSHNRISLIKDEGGHVLNSHEEIETALVQHFQGIAKETISDRDHSIRYLKRHIPRLVTREDNFNLNRLVTKEEVSEVIKEMQNGKAPGPDGFNVDFFKACWNIVKQDIMNVVEDSRMNRTILKVVANRLKPLLPTLVSVEQSVYVEGRQILNSIIQAHDMVHSLLRNRKASMIMQLDLTKAYDKLNWTYIRKVLIAFGFDHNRVRWVMALATSSSFLILVNGSPSKNFTPSRGLRQGDLLSPFLFILMMKGLGWTIKHAKEVGNIKGLQLSETR